MEGIYICPLMGVCYESICGEMRSVADLVVEEDFAALRLTH